MSKSKRLSPKQLQFRVGNRLRKYDNLNLLESFAMFMGKAQLVELSLKNVLTIKYSYDENRIERWTLGTTIKELEKCGMRKDFIMLLKDLNKHRNYIAHELLADDALMKKLAGSKAERFAWKSLERGWPAPGSEDTELGVLMEPEVGSFASRRPRRLLVWRHRRRGKGST